MQVKRDSFWRGWKDFGKFLKQYWTAYGGLGNLLRSPYLHISLIITALSYGLWSKPDWWETFLVTNPAVLGFTIGGFALVLATSAEKFGAILAHARHYEQNELDAPLAKLGSAFVHFIIVQFLSIILAILAKSADKAPPLPHLEFLSSNYARHTFWLFGFFTGVYALVCAIATAEWIFSIVVLMVKFQKFRFRIEKKHREAKNETEPPSSPKV